MKRQIFLATLLAATAPALADNTDFRFPGHRAVYELSLDSARKNSGVIGAEGRYVFDLEDACEGYALNERLVVRIARSEDRVLTDYRLSAFEAVDGSQYRFSTETEFNGVTGQKADGNLTVDVEAASAEVDYVKADDLTFDDLLLTPVAHVKAVLEAARAGEDRHAALIFDGDIDAPTYYAVTRIAEATQDEDVAGAEGIAEVKHWRIDSVYYPPKSEGSDDSATPKFAFSGAMFENGVMADLRLDYMEFSLIGELSDLEMHTSGC